jgi:hypothetical protein
VRAVVFSDNDNSAGLLIEPVHNAWPKLTAYMRELVEVMKQSIDQSAMIARVYLISPRRRRSGAGVDHHSGRLIDDGEVLIFVEDDERYVLGEGVERRRMRRAFDLDLFPALQFQLCLWRLTVDAYLTMFDQKLYARAADIRDCLRKILIKAETRSLRRGSKCMEPLF